MQGADSVQDDPNGGRVIEDGGREDMFVDCPDELNPDSREAIEISDTRHLSEEKDDVQSTHFNEPEGGMNDNDFLGELELLRGMLKKTVAEKESSEQDYEVERTAFMIELAQLHHQLKALKREPSWPNQNDAGLVDNSLVEAETGDLEENSPASSAQLHEMITECSKFLKIALDAQTEMDSTMRELHAILYMKDQEIQDLNARVTESSVYMNSKLSEAQLEKDQHIDAIANRLLTSLATTVYREELYDESVTGKISHVEKSTSLLIEKYNRFLSEIDKLRQCLTEVGSDLSVQDEVEIFVAAHDKLLELRRKDVGLDQKVNHLEDENRKLVEQLDNHKEMVEMANAEIGKRNAELEQEKTKYANTKEKLTLAVTKGKALVQQRDLLKQSLAEKISELEKCLTERTNALEAAEQSKEELVKIENLAASLQESFSQRDMTIQKCLEILSENVAIEEVESMDILEKVRWLAHERNALKVISLEFHKSKEDLVKIENLAASLQESISQRDMMIQKCVEILSENGATEEVQSMDILERVRWLAHERSALKVISLEFDKMNDILSLIDFPETVQSTDLDSRVSWLVKSFHLAKNEAVKLQDKINRTREAANIEISRLTTSLLAEIQEKNYLQEELGDLTSKYDGLVEKEHQISLEKDQMVSMLLEASGFTVEIQEEVYQPHFDMAMILDKCVGKIKEHISASVESSHRENEIFEQIQSLCYIRYQESILYKQLLEEEMLDRSEVKRLSNELVVVSQELSALKGEKGSLQRDLERTEEKAALLKEKLSMAIKKGKGLFQERENLKQLQDEKNTVIEKLKLELKHQEAAFIDCRDELDKLTADVERIPNLDADLVAVKDEKNNLQRFLVESNTMLQRVIDSIDGIVLPGDSVFEDPVEKVKWIVGYFSECQVAKTQAEKELGEAKDEANYLASNLAEAHKIINSLEDALSMEQNNVSLLAQEKRELEAVNIYVQQDLQKAIGEAFSQTSKFAEICASKKSIEDALSLAENNLSVLMNEKEDAQVGRAAAEMELQKEKEEVSVNTNKLAEAHRTIQSLEDSLFQLQKNVSLLAEEKHNAQISTTDFENEIKKLKEEAEFQASKLTYAFSTIKSLEDALSKAENQISDLIGENKIAEQEIVTLNSKLNACIQELPGTHGSIENKTLELYGHLNSLQLLLKDETLSSLQRQSFEKKIESLKDMGSLLEGMRDKMDSEILQSNPILEEDSYLSNRFPDVLDNVVNIDIVNGEVNAADGDSIILYIEKTVEGFRLRNKNLADKFEGFSIFMDELIAALLKELWAASDKVIVTLGHMKSLKQKVNDMEADKKAQENAMGILENNIKIIISAFTNATQKLELEVNNNLLELSSVSEFEQLSDSLISEETAVHGNEVAVHQLGIDSIKHVKTAENLSSGAKSVQTLGKHVQNFRNTMASTIGYLLNKLKEHRVTCEKAIEERDLNQHKISKLETDLEELQNLCLELRVKLEDYEVKDDKRTKREEELLSLYHTSSMKEREAEEDPLLSVSQMKSLFDKINGIEVPFDDFEVGDLEPHNPATVNKLFYIVDKVTRLHHQITLFSHEKEKLQSTLEKQVIEIERLKEEVQERDRDKDDSEKIKNELSEMALGLENIIKKLGGDEFVGGQKLAGMLGLLPVLEKRVVAIIQECENVKTKAEELGSKLLGTQKVVDELSSKVKALEGSNQARIAAPDTVQERGIFEVPSLPMRSEISEIEDTGPLGKKTIPFVPSAAHVRTLQKGSSDQIAIDIDKESDCLINSDEDKGHVFKSLHTSGLVPIQGKMIADRMDGIWVSSSRALMSRPRARLGLIAYCLFLHILLLGTIL